ncbi:MAG: carboxypeptidase-like regulatory domain-containing protein, partial [Bacteroidales bacterium]|nr:carboxypeptidase-like regulatory domain-containing protein [Bacteroidales bacterium]
MKISVMLKAMALTLVLFAAAGMSAFAQKTSTVVAGRVVDAYSKQPLTGAYVVLADHSVGAVVDIDGNFSLKVNQDYPINIEVTFLGFVTKTMTLDKPQAKLEIELEEEGQKLDEIVVVGYSQGLKNAMTSATKTVHAEELENTNGTSFADKLQGSV